MTRLTVDRTGDQPKNWRATKARTSGRRPEDRHYRNAGDVHDGTGDQANELDDFLWLRPDGKTQAIYEADNKQDGARRRSQHRRFSSPHSDNGQECFPGMTISDELLQMTEKVSEKPDKERTITTARA